MRTRPFCRLPVAFLLLATLLHAQTAAGADPQVTAAQGVIRRLVPEHADRFTFRRIEPVEGRDVYEVESRGGRVSIAGSSGVAMCRGAYDYLKQACGALVTWDGDQVALPDVLPDFPRTRVVCPNRYRHYFNVCTFGYTTAFWGWERWQREIDWMALHGINMPLAHLGQERVWQDVWREYGLGDDEIRAYFAGPAFLPWHRMGNINSHGGPLPQSWLDGQAELQRKVLARMRELGMRPITPGFSGFVPPQLARANPKASISRSSAWAGFEPTYLLDPRDPLFAEIQRHFVARYRETFGDDGLYLIDLYNEMAPRVNEQSKLDELRAVGRGVYESLVAANPEATWVMQGWLFFNERSWWKGPEVEAFLSEVPDDRMIILDLASEAYEVWRTHEPVRRKQWIWNTLHNYGQITPLGGHPADWSRKAIRALRDPKHGRMVGMGLTMEGIEQNAVLYELMCDTMWTSEPIDFDAWLVDYVAQRYGSRSPEAARAWTLMAQRLYGPEARTRHIATYQRRPGLGAIEEPEDPSWIREVVEALLTVPEDARRSPLYRRDLVDVTKRLVDEAVRYPLYRLAEAHAAGDAARVEAARAEFRALMLELDALLATVPQHRLGRWLEMSRSWGTSEDERRLLEYNARMQITVWGGPHLHDYARKEWAGLVAQFYLSRWERFFDALRQPEYSDAAFARTSAEWEEAWCRQAVLDKPATVDPVQQARKILGLVRPMDLELDRGIAVGKPVTDSGGTEGSHVASLANDGSASGGFWAASPSPQWWQVDLEEVRPISRVQLYPYRDGSRVYRYIIEASTDGSDWRQVVDMSRNDSPPPALHGHVHRLDEPVEARFVRVTMLHNTANIGVHLHEVRIFSD